MNILVSLSYDPNTDDLNGLLSVPGFHDTAYQIKRFQDQECYISVTSLVCGLGLPPLLITILHGVT